MRGVWVAARCVPQLARLSAAALAGSDSCFTACPLWPTFVLLWPMLSPCRFYNPYRHSLSESPLYYSYDVAGAHVIMLSSYSRECGAVCYSCCHRFCRTYQRDGA